MSYLNQFIFITLFPISVTNFVILMIQTFIGDYSLSFLRKGKVWHVPIKSRQHDNGAIRFYLVDQGPDSIKKVLASVLQMEMVRISV